MSVPYYVDHSMSEADSESSTTLHSQIPTPHFGESYSQSGYSPVMQRRQQGKSAPSMSKGNSTFKQVGRDRNGDATSTSTATSREEDDDTEFVDNDAYITFTTPSKFQIVGKEKGKVFETVQVK